MKNNISAAKNLRKLQTLKIITLLDSFNFIQGKYLIKIILESVIKKIYLFIRFIIIIFNQLDV